MYNLKWGGVIILLRENSTVASAHREEERERVSLWLCMCKQALQKPEKVEVMRSDLTAGACVSKQACYPKFT